MRHTTRVAGAIHGEIKIRRRKEEFALTVDGCNDSRLAGQFVPVRLSHLGVPGTRRDQTLHLHVICQLPPHIPPRRRPMW